MTSSTTTTARSGAGPAAGRGPLKALATAEYLQFRRNKTLLVMGTLFPVALPLATFFLARDASGPTAASSITGWETFALMAFLFVQFYSVLSMVTTRRGEGVLRRLRTSEATDGAVLAAPAVPGALLTLAGAVIVGGVIYGSGAPAPVNAVALAAALVAGIVVFSLLGLATSTITKNAEAAQITSMPVMVLAIIGQASIRESLPESLGTMVSWTPFAALSELISLGAGGTSAIAEESVPALNFVATFAPMAQPLAALGLWTGLALAIVVTQFRWDDRG